MSGEAFAYQTLPRGLAITVVILRIAWDSWRTARGHSHGHEHAH